MEQMAGTRQVRMAASYTRSEPNIRSAFSGGYVAVSSQFMVITDRVVSWVPLERMPLQYVPAAGTSAGLTSVAEYKDTI